MAQAIRGLGVALLAYACGGGGGSADDAAVTQDAHSAGGGAAGGTADGGPPPGGAAASDFGVAVGGRADALPLGGASNPDAGDDTDLRDLGAGGAPHDAGPVGGAGDVGAEDAGAGDGGAVLPVDAGPDSAQAACGQLLPTLFGAIELDAPVDVCGALGTPVFAAPFHATGPDRWAATVPLTAPNTVESSCGGSGAETILAFEVPADGLWTFYSPFSWVPYRSIHVREICDDPQSEVACGGEFAAAELTGGQVVALVVDSVVEPDDHGFLPDLIGYPVDIVAIRADAPARPSVTASAHRRADGSVEAHIRVVDPNGDVGVIVPRWLDADGQPIRQAWAFDFGGQADKTAILVAGPPGYSADQLRNIFSVEVEVTDSAGNAAGPIRAMVGDPPAAELGEPCDTGAALTCGSGLVCRAGPAGEGACTPGAAPTIECAEFWWGAGEASLWGALTGGDADADAVSARVELLPVGSDEALDYGLGLTSASLIQDDFPGADNRTIVNRTAFGWAMVPYDPFIGVLAPPFSSLVDRVRLTVSDRSGLSTSTVVPIGAPLVLGAGQACTGRAFLSPDACADGLACSRPDPAQPGACQEGAAPAVTDVHVLRYPDAPGLVVVVAGTDVDGDALWARVEVVDPDLPGVAWPFGEIYFDRVLHDGGFAGYLAQSGDGAVPLVPGTQLSVVAVDLLGLESPPFPLQVEAMPVRPAGAACSLANLDTCEPGAFCDGGTCRLL